MSNSVVSIGRVIPDGKAISRLRTEKRLSQEALAELAKISPRLLGDVERNNRPIQEQRLRDIATHLNVLPAHVQNIQLSAENTSVDKAVSLQPLPDTMLRLQPIKGALALRHEARTAQRLEWTLDVEPNSKTAKPMEGVLDILYRIVDGPTPYECNYSNHDEFDRESRFHDIPRLARLAELLQALTDGGVRVLANTYLHYLEPRGGELLPPQKRISVMFTSAETTSRTASIDPGYRGDLDADIPF